MLHLHDLEKDTFSNVLAVHTFVIKRKLLSNISDI